MGKVVFESMMRIGGSLIPVQSTFAAFFATIVVLLLTVLRPGQVYAAWALAAIPSSAKQGRGLARAPATLPDSRGTLDRFALASARQLTKKSIP